VFASSPCTFTHVLIDEAGQVTEMRRCPECVPAAGIGMGPAAASSAGCAPCPVQSGSAHPPPLPACVPAWLQALLPEALIPLALLAPPPASIGAPPASWGAVLCGDPRQLGPVVRSQVGGWCSCSCSQLCDSMFRSSLGAPLRQVPLQPFPFLCPRA
jgi:hypothetical protein